MQSEKEIKLAASAVGALQESKVQGRDMEIAAMSLAMKIPDFWQDKPRLWFLQFEAVIATQRLAGQAKFDLAVTKLGKETLEQIADILTDPPPKEERYEALKARILKVYEESAERQLQRLLNEMELGEQKPSQLLRKMKDLAGEKFPEETLVLLWRRHLPAHCRSVLAVLGTSDMEKVAVMADAMLESTRSTQLASVEVKPSGSTTDRVADEIAKLSARLADLEGGRRRRSRDSSDEDRSRQRSGSRRRVNRKMPGDPDWLCRHHFRFREKATSCVEPCAWSKAKNG